MHPIVNINIIQNFQTHSKSLRKNKQSPSSATTSKKEHIFISIQSIYTHTHTHYLQLQLQLQLQLLLHFSAQRHSKTIRTLIILQTPQTLSFSLPYFPTLSSHHFSFSSSQLLKKPCYPSSSFFFLLF